MRPNRKNKLLLAGFGLLLFLSYKFAISNTISSYREYQEKAEALKTRKFSKELIVKLRQKEREMDALSATYNITNPATFQNDLLGELARYSKRFQLKIVDFSEPHVSEKNGVVTTTYFFTFEGSFNGFLILLNQIENKPELGTVKHLNFLKKHNFKSGKDEVFFKVGLQNSK